eukprot:gene4145-7455_t
MNQHHFNFNFTSVLEEKCSFERLIPQKDNKIELFDNKWTSGLYSLIGGCIGDALLSPFEGKKPETISKMWSKPKYEEKLAPQGLIHTDDTQMSLSFIESYICNGELDNCYIKQLWIELGSQNWFENSGYPLDDYQYGGFRGTGRNFRTTVETLKKKGVDFDASSNTGGNGVAMRCGPIAIASWRALEMKEDQEEVLEYDLIKNACLTSNSPLALIPAYSYCYLLSKWVDPNDSSFLNKSSIEQLKQLILKVQKFEKKIQKFELFKGEKESDFNLTSKIYIKIYHLLCQTKMKDKEILMNKIFKLILDFAKSCTKKTIYSCNDGFALASVITSVISSIILTKENDYSFLSILKFIALQGGDTDTVGCMIGSLLGAYYGSNSKLISSNFSYFVTQQILGYKKLFGTFDQFLNSIMKNETNTNYMGEFISIEKKITLEMISVKNKERGNHYQSKEPINIEKKLQKSLKNYLMNVKDKKLKLNEIYIDFFSLEFDSASFLTPKKRIEIFCQVIKREAHSGNSYFSSLLDGLSEFIETLIQ